MSKTSQLIIVLAALASACAQQGQGESEESVETQTQALVSEPVQTEEQQVSTPSEPQSAVAPAKSNAAAQVSTRLTVRVYRDGRAEVVDAIEVPGYLKLEKHLGRGHLYEVKVGNEVLAVQGIDVDFEQRSLSPDRDVSGEVDSVEVFVDIPGVGLDNAARAEVQLHEVKAAHQEKTASIAALDRLQRAKSLKGKFRADAPQLREAIRARGRRVHPN